MICVSSICLKKLLVLTKYMLKIGFQMISCCEASQQPSWLCIYHDLLNAFTMTYFLLLSCLCLVLFSSIAHHVWRHVFYKDLGSLLKHSANPVFLSVWLCQACIQLIGGKHFLHKMTPHYSRRSRGPWCNHCIFYNGQIRRCDHCNI